MSVDSIYTYFLIVSILAAIVAILLNTLSSVEKKEKIHLFPYSVRKLFIEELKQVSDVTYDLFERRLLKNKNTDDVVIALTGIVWMALIILGAISVPSDLKIVVYYFTFNYYFFEYVIIGFIVLSFLLLVPLELEYKIYGLSSTRRKHFREAIEGKTSGSKFDENKNERRQIRLYHYIKDFSFVSALTIIGLFIQLLIVGSTPYFYYPTNLAIALIPFIIFAIFLFIILMIGRFRLSELYDLESTFLMQLALFPSTNKKLLLKTSDMELFSDKPQICDVEGIGKKLKVHYKWDDDMFISYVKWKHVIAFGFPGVKLPDAVQKRAIEEKNNSDSQFDS
jgi:hypothetical protein